MDSREGENNWFKFYYASYYRKSPYHRRAVEAGCTSWDLYNHMLIPTLYDAPRRHTSEVEPSFRAEVSSPIIPLL